MSNKRHALKVLSLAVMAALAISAFAVSSASAATWKVEGSSITESTNVTAKLKKETVGTLTGTLLGQAFELTASTLSSAGFGGVGSATISQVTTTNGNKEVIGEHAKAQGRLSFSGLTVHKPKGCTVTEPIVTKDLTAEVVTHGSSSIAYVKFFPEEGETFATIVVKGCAVAGSYPVKGTVYGEGNEFGVELASQPLKFTPAINETLGGSLTLGVNAATLSAEGENHLESGKKFGAVK